jgi:hypothetical protein
MVRRLLALEALPARDAADALAAAICRAHQNGALLRAASLTPSPVSEARRLWAQSAARPRRRRAQFVLRSAR